MPHRVVGFLGQELVYEDELTNDMLCHVEYVPVIENGWFRFAETVTYTYRCDYCGKRSSGLECKSCGAPLE